MKKPTITIRLPVGFTDNQQRLVLKYLFEGRQRISGAEWPILLRSFNQLHRAQVITQTRISTFRRVYKREVDRRFSDQYIEQLLKLSDVPREFFSLRDVFSRAIVTYFQQAGLQRDDLPATNLFLAYSLYFWESFAVGYAFEVQIYRDLTAAGIIFETHNLRDRKDRRSFSDLKVLGLSGDIKSSLYFLDVGRNRDLPHDFYVTRFYDKKGRQRILVVMLKPEAWNLINGETITMLLQEAVEAFPSPARVELQVGTVVIVDYEIWKTKVLSYQYEWENYNNG